MDKIKFSAAIIAALHGPSAVARICHINPQAVSQWLTNGIPRNRLEQLRDIFPKVIKRVEDEFAAMQDAA